MDWNVLRTLASGISPGAPSRTLSRQARTRASRELEPRLVLALIELRKIGERASVDTDYGPQKRSHH